MLYYSFYLFRELSRYYEEIDISCIEETFVDEYNSYLTVNKKTPGDTNALMRYEGRVAMTYWDNLKTIFNKLAPDFNFVGRGNQSYSWNMNASDEVNALLNYGYAVLESQTRKCINSVGLDMFKVEEAESTPIRDVWFYGISAKRYVLYQRNLATEEIKIIKYSSHGLGHLKKIVGEEVWQDILTIHYHPELKEAVLKKYDNKVAVSQLTVSSFDIYKRFRTVNQGKPYKNQIKPFNFITIGMGYQKDPKTKEYIMPMLGYISDKDKKFSSIPYTPFIDYRTGNQYPNEKSMDPQFYWKPLREVIENYLNHAESKLDGDKGQLKRRHIITSMEHIRNIGKETNDLEESMIIGVDDENYTEYANDQKLLQRIMNMTTIQAEKKGISESSLMTWKKTIREGKPLKLKKKSIKKLYK